MSKSDLLSRNFDVLKLIKYCFSQPKPRDDNEVVDCPDGVRRTRTEKFVYEDQLMRCGDRASSIAVYLYEGPGTLEFRENMVPLLERSNKLRRLRAIRELDIEFQYQLARRYASWKWCPRSQPFITTREQKLKRCNPTKDEFGNPNFPLHIQHLPKEIIAYINATGEGYPSKTSRHECAEIRHWTDGEFRSRWKSMLAVGEVLLLSDPKLGLFEQKVPAGMLAHPDVAECDDTDANAGTAANGGLPPPRPTTP